MTASLDEQGRMIGDHGIDITDLFNDPTLTTAELEAKIAERTEQAKAGLWTNPVREQTKPPSSSSSSVVASSAPAALWPWPVQHRHETFSYFAWSWDVTTLWVWLERQYQTQGNDLKKLGLGKVKTEDLRALLGWVRVDRDRLSDERSADLHLDVPLLFVELRPELGGGQQLIDGSTRATLALRRGVETLPAFMIGWYDALKFERVNPLLDRDTTSYVHPPCGASVTRIRARYRDTQTGLNATYEWFEMACGVEFPDGTRAPIDIPTTECLNCATRLTTLRTHDQSVTPLKLASSTSRKARA